MHRKSSILKALMKQLDEGKNFDAGVQYRVPTKNYVCAEQAEKEWSAFFRRHPQLIGLSGDLPGPGSFLTLEDFGTPVLATRDRSGHFRAFSTPAGTGPLRSRRRAREKRKRVSVPLSSLELRSSGAAFYSKRVAFWTRGPARL